MPTPDNEPLKSWHGTAQTIGGAVALMFLAWIGGTAWRTYEGVQENRTQNQLILIRLEKFAALERQVGDALHRIEMAADIVATMNSRLSVLESTVADHQSKFDAYRDSLLWLEGRRGSPPTQGGQAPPP